jgi:hypothetical protein
MENLEGRESDECPSGGGLIIAGIDGVVARIDPRVDTVVAGVAGLVGVELGQSGAHRQQGQQKQPAQFRGFNQHSTQKMSVMYSKSGTM